MCSVKFLLFEQIVMLCCLSSVIEESSGTVVSAANISRLFYNGTNTLAALSIISWPAGSCTADSRDFLSDSNALTYYWTCNQNRVRRTDCYDSQCTNCSSTALTLNSLSVSSVGGIFQFECGNYAMNLLHSSALVHAAEIQNETCVDTDPVLVQQALGLCVPAVSSFSRSDCCGGALVTRRGCSDPMCRNCSGVAAGDSYEAADALCARGSVSPLPSPCAPAAGPPALFFRIAQQACLWFVGQAAQPQLPIAPAPRGWARARAAAAGRSAPRRGLSLSLSLYYGYQ